MSGFVEPCPFNSTQSPTLPLMSPQGMPLPGYSPENQTFSSEPCSFHQTPILRESMYNSSTPGIEVSDEFTTQEIQFTPKTVDWRRSQQTPARKPSSSIKTTYDRYFLLAVVALKNFDEPTTVENIFHFVRINFPNAKKALRENWESAVRVQLSTNESVFLKKRLVLDGPKRGRPFLLYYLNPCNVFYEDCLTYWRHKDPSLLGIKHPEDWPIIIDGLKGFEDQKKKRRIEYEVPRGRIPFQTDNKIIEEIAAAAREKAMKQQMLSSNVIPQLAAKKTITNPNLRPAVPSMENVAIKEEPFLVVNKPQIMMKKAISPLTVPRTNVTPVVHHQTSAVLSKKNRRLSEHPMRSKQNSLKPRIASILPTLTLKQQNLKIQSGSRLVASLEPMISGLPKTETNKNLPVLDIGTPRDIEVKPTVTFPDVLPKIISPKTTKVAKETQTLDWPKKAEKSQQCDDMQEESEATSDATPRYFGKRRLQGGIYKIKSSPFSRATETKFYSTRPLEGKTISTQTESETIHTGDSACSSLANTLKEATKKLNILRDIHLKEKDPVEQTRLGGIRAKLCSFIKKVNMDLKEMEKKEEERLKEFNEIQMILGKGLRRELKETNQEHCSSAKRFAGTKEDM